MGSHTRYVTDEQSAAAALATPPTEEHRAEAADGPLPGPAPVLNGTDQPARLADGLELIGEFEDSGFKKAPFIVRRADGQVVQLPEMLYVLAEQIDGHATIADLAELFSHAIKRRVAAADVQMLIEQQLRPLGVVAQHSGGESIELGKVDPLLALKFRAAVVPDRAVRALTTVFRPLFLPPVVALVVCAMLGLDGWLFFAHGVSQSLRHTLYQPTLMLMLIGGVILATAFHEVGHATACRYGGAAPGVMGVGIYIVWPAFYTDITDAYRLGKWGRVRTDVGGMYFNAIFALVVAGMYAVTSFEPLLLLVVLQNFAIIQQSLPFLRLDGYYILSDLTGVPDIFLRIRAVLTSLIPGRPADPRVTELKSWVRVVVSAYVVLIALFLLITVVAMVINLPRMLATGYDSAALHYQAIGPAFGNGQVSTAALDGVEMLFLLLPGAGLVYTAARVGKRTATNAFTWSSGHPARQTILGLTAAAAVALALFSWLPNGEYRPIQPGERGTLTGLVRQLAALPSGRPSLTAARQQQLNGAPTERQRSTRSTRTSNREGAPHMGSRSHAGTRPATSSSSTSTSTPSTTPTGATPTTSTSTTPSSTSTSTTSITSTTPTTSTSTTSTTPAPTTPSTTPSPPTTTTPAP